MPNLLTFPGDAAIAPAGDDPAAELAITRLLDGNDLDRAASRRLFGRIVEGAHSEPLMAAAFVALRVKGETAGELIGAAEALRGAARAFPSPAYLFAARRGTGG